LKQAIEAFVKAYAQHAKPFKWRKREVKGSQLRNTLVNLCNQSLEIPEFALENLRNSPEITKIQPTNAKKHLQNTYARTDASQNRSLLLNAKRP
jgi:hypothetical protein